MEPDVVEPDVVEPDVVEPDVAELDDEEPPVVEPVVADTVVVVFCDSEMPDEPDVVELDVVELDDVELDVVEPDDAVVVVFCDCELPDEPDVVELDVEEPDVDESDVEESDVEESDVEESVVELAVGQVMKLQTTVVPEPQPGDPGPPSVVLPPLDPGGLTGGPVVVWSGGGLCVLHEQAFACGESTTIPVVEQRITGKYNRTATGLRPRMNLAPAFVGGAFCVLDTVGNTALVVVRTVASFRAEHQPL